MKGGRQVWTGHRQRDSELSYPPPDLPLRMFLNPHPVPPRTIAARRIAPAMDPIMILVPLGPFFSGPVGTVGSGMGSKTLQSFPV